MVRPANHRLHRYSSHFQRRISQVLRRQITYSCSNLLPLIMDQIAHQWRNIAASAGACFVSSFALRCDLSVLAQRVRLNSNTALTLDFCTLATTYDKTTFKILKSTKSSLFYKRLQVRVSHCITRRAAVENCTSLRFTPDIFISVIPQLHFTLSQTG